MSYEGCLVLAIRLAPALSPYASARGDVEETLALCRAKGATAERLACYDELARTVAEGVSLPSLPDAGTG